MKATEGIYRVIETKQENGMIVSGIALNRDHFIYSLHFPGHPVTPGVVLLRIVQELLESQLRLKLKLKTLTQCKFTRVIDPLIHTEFTIHTEFEIKDGFLKVKATGRNEEYSFFTLSTIYYQV